MVLKIITLVIFLLLINGSLGQRDTTTSSTTPNATARWCFQCSESNMERCNRNLRIVSCINGYSFCYSFNGTETRQGSREPFVEKGCGLLNTCATLQQRPNLNVTNCNVCPRNWCNSSNLIRSNPVSAIIIALIALFQKVVL